jgi:hypothetical protein
MGYSDKGKIKEIKNMVWDTYFRTDRNCFQMKGYRFDNAIVTDGISCSLLFVREDLYGQKYKPRAVKQPNFEPYIDEIGDKNLLKELANRPLMAIDPNLGDLIYCVNKEGDTFRYTHMQRRMESKTKKFNQIRLSNKQECMIEGKSIVEWETELSQYNCKTTVLANYESYVKAKLEMDQRLRPFYENIMFRKLKLQTFRNTRKSEQKMILNMKKNFGENTVVAFGDWEQKKHRKFKEPVKGKGFRTLLRKNGFDVYMVDEFKTSCRCWSCKSDTGVMEKCMERKDPNKKKSERKVKFVHGLLKCKTCARLWNRDANASRNILRIARSALLNQERPFYLRRTHHSGVSDG